MLKIIKSLFGPGTDYASLLKQGAQIIDVRSPAEFSGGHIPGSVNIPLPQLQVNKGRIQKDKPVITCCASGMRSARAKTILQSEGYTQVYNGGGWVSLQHKVEKE